MDHLKCLVFRAACRYVVQKVRAAVTGETKPEKSTTAPCSQAKGECCCGGALRELWFLLTKSSSFQNNKDLCLSPAGLFLCSPEVRQDELR